MPRNLDMKSIHDNDPFDYVDVKFAPLLLELAASPNKSYNTSFMLSHLISFMWKSIILDGMVLLKKHTHVIASSYLHALACHEHHYYHT